MLTVVTPAASLVLTTVERARALAEFGNLSDEEVTLLLQHASAAISDFCKRIFYRQTYRQTFTDRELADGEIMLAQWPVTNIASVIIDGTSLAPDSYRQDDQWLCRVAGGRPRAWCGVSAEVIFTAGYSVPPEAAATLPLPVERAVALEAAAYFEGADRDELLKAETVDGVGSFSYRVPSPGDSLTSPSAAQLLKPYAVPRLV
ncbi:hypothetical protein J2X65_003153 [Ancylobacter sp. 3268]|uniref:hypothetical protein n=1 Tax=Ancylobacter sp. 3268 TaxID=2817752 RepID=UPI0028641FCE|nr:hypothetical protein [Ancylobacter sp. 3268]MDR6953790.1 hypothetical protein [Ancylobacter sp. 3268]